MSIRAVQALIVNDDEQHVRTSSPVPGTPSLLPVVQELERRVGNKRWTTRKGSSGRQAFTRTNLYKLLTNVALRASLQNEVHRANTRPSLTTLQRSRWCFDEMAG